jgi:Asp-tRNA(Asn)/Glu-tRNA(Gln) amidotransferase A subunit family amidase
MTAREAVEAALGVVERREPNILAFAYLDPARARREADTVDARVAGPLTGVVLGVKDVFDTADMPTAYGSPIYRGFQPAADAAVIAQLRSAGATVLGKTVTAEFAATHPGPTRNPLRLTHTPGGSSMGSAAATAASMVELALGTQTAGSVLRPASFCGVYGLKPTYGTVSVAGVKPHAPSLDTVGWFARRTDVLATTLSVLTGRAALPTPTPASLSIGLCRGEDWSQAEPDSQAAVLEAVARLEAAGARVEERRVVEPFVGLTDQQRVIQSYEVARSFAFEYHVHGGELSDELRATIEEGRKVSVARYDAARRAAAVARGREDELFGDADVLLTPVVVGEAPAGLASTGDPRFCRPFTLLGSPALTVPGLSGHSGLPIGIQLVARSGDDARLLAIGSLLGALLSE